MTRYRAVALTTRALAGGSLLAVLGSGCYSGLGFDAMPTGEPPPDADDSPSDSGEELEPPQSPEVVAPIGLRRLTAAEYDATLRDLLLDDSSASNLVLPEDLRTPFDNDYTLQDPSLALVEGVDLLASDAATRLLADPATRDEVLGCTPAGPGDAECFEQIVTGLGRRAFRRPLTEQEVAGFMGMLDHAVEHEDFYTGVDSLVRALLQAPSFLYRVELGTPVEGEPGLWRLDGYEVASRLSYLLWGTMPSDALFELAEAGALDTAAGVREAAAEMLEDPRALDRIDRFHALWMGYESLPHSYELVVGMQQETRALMERILFDERRPWQDLLRLEETFVDDALAEHYEIEGPGGDGPAWVPYAGEIERKGLLSHGSFLSLGAKFGDTSPTQRGILVQSRLFCLEIEPPPPDPNINVDEPPGDPEEMCKADRYAAHQVLGSSCRGCHELVDPIGFGLENFDEQGRYRTHDNGKPECVIEGQGEVSGVGEFSGPAQLADLVIESGRLNRCVATQLYRFTVGRYALGAVDEDFLDMMSDAVGDGDFRFDELVLEFVGSDMFRFRRQEEL